MLSIYWVYGDSVKQVNDIHTLIHQWCMKLIALVNSCEAILKTMWEGTFLGCKVKFAIHRWSMIWFGPVLLHHLNHSAPPSEPYFPTSFIMQVSNSACHGLFPLTSQPSSALPLRGRGRLHNLDATRCF